jgi:hypothetical protein
LTFLNLACADQEPATAPAATGPAQLTQAQSVLKALGAEPSALVERIDGGQINWTTAEVFAVGEGKAAGLSGQQIDMAKRAARLAAARNVVLVLAGIRTGPGGRFRNFREGTISVDAVVRDFQEASDDFDRATRIATVRLKMPLYGAQGAVRIGGLVLAGPVGPAKALAVKGGQPQIIVIDARGTGFAPCMLPRIARPSGQTVFEPVQAGFDPAAAQRPPVVYLHLDRHDELTPTKPKTPAAAGTDGPAVIYRAQKSPPRSPGTLVLSDEDASDLIDYIASGGLLSAGRVVVVSDSPSQPPATAPASATSPATRPSKDIVIQ